MLVSQAYSKQANLVNPGGTFSELKLSLRVMLWCTKIRRQVSIGKLEQIAQQNLLSRTWIYKFSINFIKYQRIISFFFFSFRCTIRQFKAIRITCWDVAVWYWMLCVVTLISQSGASRLMLKGYTFFRSLSFQLFRTMKGSCALLTTINASNDNSSNLYSRPFLITIMVEKLLST